MSRASRGASRARSWGWGWEPVLRSASAKHVPIVTVDRKINAAA